MTYSYGGNVRFDSAINNLTALNVGARLASVAADPKSKIYGAPNPALTATVTGTINGDALD